MTSETHLFIEPSDVLGIELECTKCKTRLSLTLNGLSRSVRECPSCQTVWLENDTQERALVQKFLAEMESLNSALQGRSFRLKIEITRPD